MKRVFRHRVLPLAFWVQFHGSVEDTFWEQKHFHPLQRPSWSKKKQSNGSCMGALAFLSQGFVFDISERYSHRRPPSTNAF